MVEQSQIRGRTGSDASAGSAGARHRKFGRNAVLRSPKLVPNGMDRPSAKTIDEEEERGGGGGRGGGGLPISPEGFSEAMIAAEAAEALATNHLTESHSYRATPGRSSSFLRQRVRSRGASLHRAISGGSGSGSSVKSGDLRQRERAASAVGKEILRRANTGSFREGELFELFPDDGEREEHLFQCLWAGERGEDEEEEGRKTTTTTVTTATEIRAHGVGWGMAMQGEEFWRASEKGEGGEIAETFRGGSYQELGLGKIGIGVEPFGVNDEGGGGGGAETVPGISTNAAPAPKFRRNLSKLSQMAHAALGTYANGYNNSNYDNNDDDHGGDGMRGYVSDEDSEFEFGFEFNTDDDADGDEGLGHHRYHSSLSGISETSSEASDASSTHSSPQLRASRGRRAGECSPRNIAIPIPPPSSSSQNELSLDASPFLPDQQHDQHQLPDELENGGPGVRRLRRLGSLQIVDVSTMQHQPPAYARANSGGGGVETFMNSPDTVATVARPGSQRFYKFLKPLPGEPPLPPQPPPSPGHWNRSPVAPSRLMRSGSTSGSRRRTTGARPPVSNPSSSSSSSSSKPKKLVRKSSSQQERDRVKRLSDSDLAALIAQRMALSKESATSLVSQEKKKKWEKKDKEKERDRFTSHFVLPGGATVQFHTKAANVPSTPKTQTVGSHVFTHEVSVYRRTVCNFCCYHPIIIIIITIIILSINSLRHNVRSTSSDNLPSTNDEDDVGERSHHISTTSSSVSGCATAI